MHTRVACIARRVARPCSRVRTGARCCFWFWFHFQQSGVIAVPSGIVKWFDPGRGVGVIAQDDAGRDVVAYRSAIQGNWDRRLVEGERVLFNVTQDSAGIRADNIHRVPAG